MKESGPTFVAVTWGLTETTVTLTVCMATPALLLAVKKFQLRHGLTDDGNIGAGTVTCNYDGVGKHKTEIGPHAFIGSDTMLVAPVRVGARAMTGSGSVITEDVPDDALAISRSKQVNKPGLAARLMQALRQKKGK